MTSALAEWFSGPRGAALLALESALVGETLEDCFGWEMLQVGAWGKGRGLLRGARTRSQALAASSSVNGCDFVSRLSQLPIASDSVDTVLLPHTLEFESDPYSVLREADRVLAGDGKLIILAFAPFSPWGLRAATTRAGYPPGLRRVISERRLRDWLRLLGYDIGEPRRYLHELPWGEPATVTGRIRRPWWYPLPGSAVVLKARKRSHSLTPLRPRLRERVTRVLGGLTEPSSASRRPP